MTVKKKKNDTISKNMLAYNPTHKNSHRNPVTLTKLYYLTVSWLNSQKSFYWLFSTHADVFARTVVP